ncbi:hypothetical protein [Amycolatopsis speibonae]|uniref:Uncharacterized protein n=1 Tax=Amycolatopsis speibonae TaxID=1450224 RepID=A0ABV7P4J2_9PSEU
MTELDPAQIISIGRIFPGVKRIWLDALRSGEFRQARGAMRLSDGFMDPLGILCELYRRDQGGNWAPRDDGWVFRDARNQYAAGGDLTPAILKWAGSRASRCGLAAPGATWAIANLNDSGAPFAEIAELIEENL